MEENKKTVNEIQSEEKSDNKLSSFRFTQKIIAIMLCVACVLTVMVGVTVSYLASISGPIENVFTVGQIKLNLTETSGNSYQLIPGKAVPKDPKVTVLQGSEACWLFVKVTKSSEFDDYLTYEIADGWTYLGGFEGVYYRTVPETEWDTSYQILKNDVINVKDNLTEEKMSAITENPSISFVAYAVQSYSVDDVIDAWILILAEEGNG